MKERERAAHAARSFVHNRELKPKVEERLGRAVASLESYLLRHDTQSANLGRYKVELVDGQVVVSELPPEGWEQLEMSGLRPDADLGEENGPDGLDSPPTEGI